MRLPRDGCAVEEGRSSTTHSRDGLQGEFLHPDDGAPREKIQLIEAGDDVGVHLDTTR